MVQRKDRRFQSEGAPDRDSKYQTTDLRLYRRGSNERFSEKNRRISMRGTETQRAVIRDQSEQEMVTK